MNYSGKFDAMVSADGVALPSSQNLHVKTVHPSHVPADAIIVEDAHLLFNGQFKRSGVDLVLSKDGSELVLHDYFKGEKRATLSSPDGAHLGGDLVNALAGNVQYAQADGSTSVNKVIGHVTKLVGTATAVRNGVAVILHNGENVEKGDVVESGANSTLGITFIDGTVFGLLSNARMVLNEMVYDPNGSNNSSLLSLVAGTITFVAGETAKHGDMKVDTPVATMGIRGTAVLCEIDFTVPGQATPDAKFQVLVEPDGSTGSYILFDKTTLTPLAVVDRAGTQINISNGVVSQTSAPLSPEIQKLITDVFSLKFSDNSNTRSLDHHTDTLIPQSLAPIQLASGVTALPFVLNVNNTTSGTTSSSQNGPGIPGNIHIAQAPTISLSGDAALTVRTGSSQSTGFDTVSGMVHFTDINAGDLPTVSTNFVSFKLMDAQNNDITATLTSQQLAQIAAVEAQLVVTPSPGNNNNGSARWTYSVADSAFNFLTAGQTLVLTYNATVDNNFPPNDETASKSFTITISGPNSVEWIHPTSGLWSVGSNWSTGAVPTASQDAIIPAQHIPGGSGLYDVTIAAPAFARNLTLNANKTTGGQVTNDSTLTVGQMLTVFTNGVLDNFGTIIAGKLELFDQSLLQNSGLIRLGQGGDFTESQTIINSGTIELAGGTLNVQVDIDNGGGTIKVDGGSTLNLNGVAISGGTVSGGGFGAVNVTADSSINGGEGNAALNDISVTVASGVTLRLDNVTASDTTFDDLAAGSAILVDAADRLVLNDVTIKGGTINDNGTIDVTGDSLLDGTASHVVLNGGVVTVESDVTLRLDDVTANATTFNDLGGGTLQVDAGDTLVLNGVTIEGGTINDNGDIVVVADSAIIGSETNVVLNDGVVTVESDVTLKLDNVTANDTTFDDLAAGSTIQVDAGDELVLNGVTIVGGTINDNGTIDVTGDSELQGSASNLVLNNGVVTVESQVTLRLDDVTANMTRFNDLGGGTLRVEDTLNLNGATVNGGSIANNGAVNIKGAVTFEDGVAVDGGLLSIAKSATLDIENPVTGIGASLNGVSVMNSGTIQVDSLGPGTTVITLLLDQGTIVTGGTLLIHIGFPINGIEGAVEIGTGGASFDGLIVANNNLLTIDDGNRLSLSQVTFNGGTIDNGTLGGAGGLMDFIGNGSINGIAISDGEGFATLNATLNNGVVKLESGVTLTLDNVAVNGTTFNDAGSVIQVGAGDTLTLSGVTVNGGTIDNGAADGAGGAIDVFGDSSINGVSAGAGATTVNAILNDGGVTIGSEVTLTLDNVTVNRTTFTGVDASSIIQVDGGDVIAFNSAAFDGGTLNVFGELVSTGVSFITDAIIVNAGFVEADNAELDLVNTSITNIGTIQSTGTGVLNLKNAVINGGTIAGPGRIATAFGNVESILNGVTIAAGALVLAVAGALDLRGTITNNGEVDATTGQVDIENANLAGGVLGGTGTITTAGANVDSTLSDVTIANGSAVTAAVGTLDLSGIITNHGALKASSGIIHFEDATIDGGTLGGSGLIATASGANTLDGVAILAGTTVHVTDNTALELAGTIPLSGSVALDSTGDATQLKISGSVVLDGGGQVTLSDDANNSIVSDGSAATLANFDLISGAGTIGDIHLTLVNSGTIEATGAHPLIIDTGTNTLTSGGLVGSLLITNNAGGVLEASAGHTLQIDDNVLNNGLIQAGNPGSSSAALLNITGNITGTGSIELFNNAMLTIGGSVSAGQTVTFESAGGAARLILNDSHDFQGTIIGLTEYPTESQENHVDLTDLAFRAGHMHAFYSGGILTVSNGLDSVSLHVLGSSDPAFELAADSTGGTLVDDPSPSGSITIDSGKTLDISGASAAAVTFANTAGNTGELVLDSSNAFTGQIIGFAGDGTLANSDLIDLADINIADVAIGKTTYTDNGNGSGTLTLYNANGQALDSISFEGSYQLANFTIENDGTGHTLIVDQPVTNSSLPSQPASGVTMLASAPNQTLTGSASSDNFAFNFASVGHTTITDFRPETDTLQFSSSIFANALSVLNATHDNGHGDAVIAIDAHDSITLNGVLKAQLHVSDFHVV